MSKITIEALKIKIDEELTLDLSVDKARKLRDALLELFPTPVVSPIVIEKHIHEWPYYRWQPYRWTSAEGHLPGYDSASTTQPPAQGYESQALFCNVSDF